MNINETQLQTRIQPEAANASAQKKRASAGQTLIPKTPSANGREDGQATKARIIDHAGRLFAIQGYDKTTSKEICTAAQVNSAAVNYHFGSREALYEAVLGEVQHYLMDLAILRDIADSDAPPDKRLLSILDFFLAQALSDSDWHIKLWIREVLSPSPMMHRVITSSALPKFSLIGSLLSDYLGYDMADPRLYGCYISLLSPFALTAIMQHSPLLAHAPISMSRDTYTTMLRNNFICQLNAFKQRADEEQS